MNSVTSYRERRYQTWFKNRADWPIVLTRWRTNREIIAGKIPESGVSLRLYSALDCLYANDREYADAFLRETISHAEANLAVDNCRATPVALAGHPYNQAVMERAICYARWLLGAALDRPSLRQVSEHLTTWCLTKAVDHKRFNDSMTMDVYLGGVRTAMLSGDVVYTKELLRTKHKFRWHHAGERELWTRLLEVYPQIDAELRGRFEQFFDKVRDPDFQDLVDGNVSIYISREILALETGMIRQMYLVNRSLSDSIDPALVIAAVAA